MSPSDVAAAVAKISSPPPPGAPFALPVPNSATPNRSAAYRHWRFRDSPLLETLEAGVLTLHDAFEVSAKHVPKKQFLGWRPWNTATQTHDETFVWMTYGEVAERRKNLGAGLVEIHKQVGVTADKYAIGLWCQNRPEWQITGMFLFYFLFLFLSVSLFFFPLASSVLISLFVHHDWLICH